MLFVVAAALPPLCFGCVASWGPALVAALGAVLVVGALAVHGPPTRPPPVALAALVGLAWTAMGLVPVPVVALRALTTGRSPPIVVEHAQVAASLMGDPPPTWLAWSASPVDSRAAVVVGVAVLAFVLAGAVAVVARRRRVVVVAVAASSIALALVAMAHLALDTDHIYGIYVPPEPLVFPSPLRNENHAAALLALGVPLCLTLAMSTENRMVGIGWLVGAGVVAIACVRAFSRGGLLGLGVGLVVLAATRMRARAHTGARSGQLWTLVAILGVALALVLAAFVWFEPLAHDLGTTTLYKLRIAARGLDLAARSPWVGVGRGGYSAAFVSLYGTETRIEYPESFPVQWVAEWGLPFGGGLLLFMGARSMRALRSSSSLEQDGAIAALLGLGAHELVDFATEMPGIVVVAGLLAAAALVPEGARSGTARRGPLAWWAVPCVAAALAAAPGISLIGTRPGDVRAAIEAALAEGDSDRALGEISDALRDRPGEPVWVVLGAVAHARRGDAETPRWLNAAMRLAPHWSAPHVVAAQWLRHVGRREQSWLEVREVERREPLQGRVTTSCGFLASREDGETVVRIMRNEAGGLAFLEALVAGCPGADPGAQRVIDDALLVAGAPAARRRAAERAVADGHPEEALARIAGLDERDVSGISLVRADALVLAGRPSEAIEVLSAMHPTDAQRADQLSRLAQAHAAAGDAEAMRAVIGQLSGLAQGAPARIAAALILRGQLEQALGNRAEAYQSFERADALDRNSGALIEELRIAEALGDAHREASLRARLCSRGSTVVRCAPGTRP